MALQVIAALLACATLQQLLPEVCARNLTCVRGAGIPAARLSEKTCYLRPAGPGLQDLQLYRWHIATGGGDVACA